MLIQKNLARLGNFFLLLFMFAAATNAAANNYNLPDRYLAVTVPGLQADPDHFDIQTSSLKGQVPPLALSGTWRIFGGTVLTKPPSTLDPRLIELHGLVGTDRKLIVRVWVRYYQTTSGWQPMYKLDQEPVMIPTPGGWKPLFDSPVSPEVVEVLNWQQHPNPDGFRSYIDFKLYRSKVSIDSWQVKDHP